MNPWQSILRAIDGPSDAIRYACILEATAPKVGNVHPAASFDDLCFADFVTAADITAKTIDCAGRSVGERVAETIRQVRSETGTNVNLGIALLLAPLLVAEQTCPTTEPLDLPTWKDAAARVVDGLDLHQGGLIAGAIADAGAGGLDGSSRPSEPSLDVNHVAAGRYDLIAAMQLASSHDRIALQYASGFGDLFDVVVPMLDDDINTCGDLLSGIVRGHVRLLADGGDSLILRKQGGEASRMVQQLASQSLERADGNFAELDRLLRSSGNQLNPGTTADLVAAAIYVLLRTKQA